MYIHEELVEKYMGRISIIVPNQCNRHITEERKDAHTLAREILIQGIYDLVFPEQIVNLKGEDWETDALEWFYEKSEEPCGFAWVCDILSISMDEAQKCIIKMMNSNYSLEQRKQMVRRLPNLTVRK